LFLFSIASAQEQGKNPLAYKNEAMGIEITGPEGWSMWTPEKGDVSFSGLHVIFSRYPVGSKEKDNPKIILEITTVRDVSGKIKGGKNPLEQANYVLKTMSDNTLAKVLSEVIVSTQKGAVKEVLNIIQEPGSVKINNQEGARYAYERRNLDGILGKNYRESNYVFMKDSVFYELSYGSRIEYFDEHLKEFEEAVNTFVLK